MIHRFVFSCFFFLWKFVDWHPPAAAVGLRAGCLGEVEGMVLGEPAVITAG